MRCSEIPSRTVVWGLRFVAISLVTLALAGCGGGGGAGVVGAVLQPAVQTANGTVNGLASVVVNGVEYQDARADSQVENADGSVSNASVKLGQSVQIAHDGQGTASSVTVNAAVIGSVSQVNAAAQTLTVAGQSVVANTSTTVGPVTLYGGGYTGFADIKAADLAEVHGNPVYNSTTKSYQLLATRIEKQASISAIRVSGSIANLNTGARTFAINGLTVGYGTATLAPSSAVLANGVNVAVWGAAGSLSGSGSTLSLAASRVRVASVLAAGLTSGITQLSGLADSVTATSFQLQGVTVLLGTATTLSPTGAKLANGAYVDLTGVIGSSGSLTATSIRVREQSTASDNASVRLMGAISSLTSQGAFIVRDVPIDASAIVLATACPGVTLAVGSVVDVAATLQSGTNVVKATALRCSSTAPAYTIRSVTGTASAVDTTAKSFTLTPSTAAQATQKVVWSAQTAFSGVTPSVSSVTSTTVALSGATVVVEGYLDSSNVLIARSIRNPAATSGRRDADAFDANLAAVSGTAGSVSAWTTYLAPNR